MQESPLSSLPQVVSPQSRTERASKEYHRISIFLEEFTFLSDQPDIFSISNGYLLHPNQQERVAIRPSSASKPTCRETIMSKQSPRALDLLYRNPTNTNDHPNNTSWRVITNQPGEIHFHYLPPSLMENDHHHPLLCFPLSDRTTDLQNTMRSDFSDLAQLLLDPPTTSSSDSSSNNISQPRELALLEEDFIVDDDFEERSLAHLNKATPSFLFDSPLNNNNSSNSDTNNSGNTNTTTNNPGNPLQSMSDTSITTNNPHKRNSITRNNLAKEAEQLMSDIPHSSDNNSNYNNRNHNQNQTASPDTLKTRRPSPYQRKYKHAKHHHYHQYDPQTPQYQQQLEDDLLFTLSLQDQTIPSTLDATLVGHTFSVVSITKAGTITAVDESFSKLFGYSGEESIGQNLDLVFASPPKRTFISLISIIQSNPIQSNSILYYLPYIITRPSIILLSIDQLLNFEG